MKLPPDSLIDPRKITHYLLQPRAKSDKSGFLALAGYDTSHAPRLMDDLRGLLITHEAEFLENTPFGQFHAIPASLTGPNGHTLRVRTIWMKEHLSGQTKFITLIPEKNPTHDL
jgi:hypothetical protein